jgi:outer membrane protein OmpA-like peptidoglycan-associated protein
MKQLAPYTSLFMLLAFTAGPALAQSAEQKVNGYVPPPLFGAPPASQPRPSVPALVTPKSSNTAPAMQPLPPANAEIPGYVKPRVSRSNEGQPVKVEPYIPKFPPLDPVPLEQTPAGRGMIVDRPSSPKEAPLPGRKPPVPVTAPVISETPAVIPVPAPVAPATAQAAPAAPAPVETKNAMPAQKVTSQGVVTGPKTMPTAPTSQVESETVFTPTVAQDKTLLEQHAERQKEAARAAAPSAPVAPVMPPAVPAGLAAAAPAPMLGTDKSKLSLPFTPGTGTLTPEQTQTLAQQILPLLQQNAGARLQIQAFATPVDKSQSSDRRVSLSRALAIRDSLMVQGIEARRIDVRALGAGPDGKPTDRVDLVVIGR